MSDVCRCETIHREKLELVAEAIPREAEIAASAALFRLLGDPGRLKILQALAVEELCVCDLATFLQASDSAVSHQLRLLREARLVRNRREGKVIYYRLDDDHVAGLLQILIGHIREKVV